MLNITVFKCRPIFYLFFNHDLGAPKNVFWKIIIKIICYYSYKDGTICNRGKVQHH